MSLNSELQQILIDWLNDELVAKIKEEMNTLDVNASRNLTQSINVSQAQLLANSDVVAEVLMSHYWKYINYGVNGTEINRGAPTHGKGVKTDLTFHEAILEWIPSRGYTIPAGFKNYDSWAYAIMTNIRKFGKEKKPFINNAIDKLDYSSLENDIVKAFANEIRKGK